MADVTVNYTVKVPDEQFLDGFSENKTKEFTYNGPEELVVTMDNQGNCYTQKLDGPVYDGELQVTINVTDNPNLLPIADLLYGRPYDHQLTFDEEDLGDGVTYKVANNSTIHDWYWIPKYDAENDGWFVDSDGVPILELIVRDALSPKMRTYLAKADMFIEILDQFEHTDANATALTAYKAAVETYRNQVATPWKYDGQNPFDLQAPKMPIGLVAEINAAKSAGVDQMMKLGDDEII